MALTPGRMMKTTKIPMMPGMDPMHNQMHPTPKKPPTKKATGKKVKKRGR